MEGESYCKERVWLIVALGKLTIVMIGGNNSCDWPYLKYSNYSEVRAEFE